MACSLLLSVTKRQPHLPCGAYLPVQVFRVMKGAPQVVLKRAHNFNEIRAGVEAKIVEFANRCSGSSMIA